MNILNNSLRGALSAPTDAYVHGNEEAATEEVVGEDVADDSKDKEIQSSIIIIETSTEVIDAEHIENMSESEIEADENAQEVIEDLVGIVLNPQAEPAYSFALVKSSVPLYSRSLLFWVGAIAFATLFI